MAVRLILKNSSVEDKRPTSSQLDQGEISLNTNVAGPFLCCEDSEGNIQQIGGVKITNDAPGTPVRGTFWLNTANDKLYIFDGQNWIAVAGSGGGGGGGGGGIDTVIGGDGIDASQLGEIVTIDNDIDRNRGLEFVSGRTAVALGSGLSFDADGKVKAESTAMTYKGTIDLTGAAVPGTPATGDSYANIGSGNFSAEWLAATGEPDPTTANPGDLVIWNGTKWTYVPTGSGGGGGSLPTDLSIGAHDANELEIDSSTGTDVVLPLVDEADDKCGLMSPDDKAKLDTVEAGAQANVNADWDADSGDAEILNKPEIPAAQVNSDWDATSGVAEILNKPDLGVTQITAGTNIAIDPVAGTGNVTINVEGTDAGVTEIVAGNNVTIDPADGLGAVTVNAADPGIGEAPDDGKQYARQNEAWSEITGGGGVTQIVAGDNVTIDPVDGLGTVTINSTGGGSGSGVSSIIAGAGIAVDQATGDVTITNTGGGGGGGGGETKADIYGIAKAYLLLKGPEITGTEGAPSMNGVYNSRGITGVGKVSLGNYFIDFEAGLFSNTDYIVTGLVGTSIATGGYIGYENDANGARTTTRVYFSSATPGAGANFNYFNIAVFDNEPAEIIVGSGTVANTNIFGTAKAWANVAADATVLSGSNCTVSQTVKPDGTVVAKSAGIYWVTFNTPISGSYSVTLGQYQVDSWWDASSATSQGFLYVTVGTSEIDAPMSFAVFDNKPAEVALTTFGDVINYSGASAWGKVANDGTLENGLNIASVTRINNGVYDVVFSTPMPDAKYAITGMSADNGSVLLATSNITAGGFTLTSMGSGSGNANDFGGMFAVFATNALPPKGGTGTDAWATCAAGGAIEASFNIASVTKVSTGVYDVVFTTPMPTNKYAVSGTVEYPTATNGALAIRGDKTVNGFTVQLVGGGLAVYDYPFDFTVNATNATLPQTVTQEQIESAINNPGASAWGNVEADGTLQGGLNVTVTKTSTGTYAVTFLTPMPNANYSLTSGYDDPDYDGSSLRFVFFDNKTANGFTVRTKNNSGFIDYSFDFAVFATNALPPKGGTGTDAWGSVQADGTIDASFNVASVTKVSTGKHDVVFTTPMPDANYAVLGTTWNPGTTVLGTYTVINNKTSAGFTLYTYTSGTVSVVDSPFSFTVNATNATLPSTITQEQAQEVLNFIATGGNAPVAILSDIQTASEASTSGWKDRTFNTVDDAFNLVSLDANETDFTLQPGAYLIEWFGTSLQSGYVKSRLSNVTTGATVGLGSSSYSNSTGDYACVMTHGTVRVQIASASAFKIEQYSSATSGYGFGIGASQGGEDDLFAQVTITGTPSV